MTGADFIVGSKARIGWLLGCKRMQKKASFKFRTWRYLD
jgi:hypothetical protein